ncbi:hypothetical protein KM043_006641 [Ampulex compressa]|nr:hypothetical protein KM043_006641 [Ampulex compressa]
MTGVSYWAWMPYASLAIGSLTFKQVASFHPPRRKFFSLPVVAPSSVRREQAALPRGKPFRRIEESADMFASLHRAKCQMDNCQTVMDIVEKNEIFSFKVALAILLATGAVALTTSQETEISAKGLEVAAAPVKLDKNLRRALLKALADLDAESAEQHKEEEAASPSKSTGLAFGDVMKKAQKKDLAVVQKSVFSFNGFPGDEEIPSEDKLQNSSFVETERYAQSGASSMTIEKASREDARSFHVQNVIVPEKKSSAPSTIASVAKIDQLDTRKLSALSKSTVTKLDSITLKPSTQISEGLAGSASHGIAAANSLISPKPTVPSPTVEPSVIEGSSTSRTNQERSEEVKIFEAPLVAAFTVQQDELGRPKSVVPIYRNSGDGQALTLQEQLDFKQQLLEKQLAELQQQQIQQTQFLVRQRQLYEQQLRQKQHHELYLQEQARLKQLEEQAKLKHLEDQRLKQLEEQRLKQIEGQRFIRFQQQQQQQQHSLPLKQRFFEQSNNLQQLHSPLESSNVRLQPSVALEVPNTVVAPPFQINFREQLRLQQIQQQQQQQHPQQRQQQPLQQQSLQQQQRLQQSFASFPTDFQPPLTTASRFNRQEAFNSVGNFGFNLDNKPTATRSNFGFNAPPRSQQAFVYNPYVQFRQTRPPTPAKQIQRLLYQSGVAGDLGNAQGSGGQEDLNIVSKVLALNVGALPVAKNLQYATNNRGNHLLDKTPGSA